MRSSFRKTPDKAKCQVRCFLSGGSGNRNTDTSRESLLPQEMQKANKPSMINTGKARDFIPVSRWVDGLLYIVDIQPFLCSLRKESVSRPCFKKVLSISPGPCCKAPARVHCLLTCITHMRVCSQRTVSLKYLVLKNAEIFFAPEEPCCVL